MSGLVLKLAPRERVLINGAVIENGDRRSRISIVTPNASILRLREALHPDEANTPVKRVCYILQLLLCGEAEKDVAIGQIEAGISSLVDVFLDPDAQEILRTARSALSYENHYKCLKAMRSLISIEAKYLGSVPTASMANQHLGN